MVLKTLQSPLLNTDYFNSLRQIVDKKKKNELPSAQVVQQHLVYHPDLDVHPTQGFLFLPDTGQRFKLGDITSVIYWSLHSEYFFSIILTCEQNLCLNASVKKKSLNFLKSTHFKWLHFWKRFGSVQYWQKYTFHINSIISGQISYLLSRCPPVSCVTLEMSVVKIRSDCKTEKKNNSNIECSLVSRRKTNVLLCLQAPSVPQDPL